MVTEWGKVIHPFVLPHRLCMCVCMWICVSVRNIHLTRMRPYG